VPEISLADLVEATGGKLLRGDAATRVDSFGIDSRKLARGSVFFALAGERTDGHRFLADAASRNVSGTGSTTVAGAAGCGGGWEVTSTGTGIGTCAGSPTFGGALLGTT
jgi:hypothetical protein